MSNKAALSVEDPRPQNVAAVERMYDEWAQDYHTGLNSSQMEYNAHKIVAEAVTKAFQGVCHVRDILDAGTGTGLLAEELKRDFPMARFTGLDISQKMLDEARDRDLIDEAHKTNLDGHPWPVSAEKYDAVISAGVTGLISNMGYFLEQAARSLKPEGIIATTFLRFSRGKNIGFDFSPENRIREYAHHHLPFNRMAEAAGFKKINDDTDFIAIKTPLSLQCFGLYLGRKM